MNIVIVENLTTYYNSIEDIMITIANPKIFIYHYIGVENVIKVLIIEDDPMVRMIHEGYLGKVEGYTLLKSINCIEVAKKEILKVKPDLILLDIFFSKGLGTDFLKWVRSNSIKCDVIVITADTNMETVEETLRYGAVDYIIKPFTFDRFKESLIKYKTRKKDFKNTESAEQELIDKMIFKEKNTECNDGESIKDIKGFSQYTYEKIIDLIKNMQGESIAAQDLAKLSGVSRITARRYLDLLEKEGKLEVKMDYGKVGRPINKYTVKEY